MGLCCFILNLIHTLGLWYISNLLNAAVLLFVFREAIFLGKCMLEERILSGDALKSFFDAIFMSELNYVC